MKIFNMQEAIEKVNRNREIIIKHDDCLIPIKAIYIDTKTNKVVLDTHIFMDDCENCIHEGDGDGCEDIYGNTKCEFIPRNKIILH